MTGWGQNDRDGKWNDLLGPLLIPSFLVQSGHSKAIPVIPMGWGPISFQAHSIWEWPRNETYLILRSFLMGMSLEWRILRLQDFCHWRTRNDRRMSSEWVLNDWMTWEWVRRTEIFDGEYLITLIPWSSLSFWVIVKWPFSHSRVIQILNDIRMKEMLLEW